MKILKSAAVLTAVLLLGLIVAPAHAADTLWVHVDVDEGPDGAKVKVNLPLTFVETALQVVPDKEMRGGRLVLHDTDLTAAELREMWASLKTEGDAVLVEADEDGEEVRVFKRGEHMLVEVREPGRDTRVDVRIPERVIDALLATDGEELDLAGALRALAAAGEGELVAVDDRETRVRVWVDASPESR